MGTTEDPEKQILERIERVQNRIIDEVRSIIEDRTEDELKAMTYNGDESETDKLYTSIGEILFGDEDVAAEIDKDLHDITNDMKSDCIVLQLADGSRTQDATDYLFHEYKDQSLDFKWMRVDPKFNIVVDKINSFGW